MKYLSPLRNYTNGYLLMNYGKSQTRLSFHFRQTRQPPSSGTLSKGCTCPWGGGVVVRVAMPHSLLKGRCCC